jgi:CHASE2 domain-containing sensor protein
MALMAKMGVAGAALFLLLQAFPPAPTLIGFGIGIAAITLRGLAGFEALTGAEA